MPPEDSYPENENPEHVQSWTSDIRKVNPKMFKEHSPREGGLRRLGGYWENSDNHNML